MERLLALRRKAKKRKPNFVVKASHFSARIKPRWRRPIGRHSPIRQMIRGKPALVRIGYGSPREVRHLHRSGLRMALVHTAQELEAVKADKQGVIISGKLGGRKRLALLRQAQAGKITVFNLKAEKKIKELEEGLAARKKKRQERLSTKAQKQQEKEKKAAEKKKEKKEEKAAPTAEERKEEEQELKEKTLTKRQ